MRHVYVHLFLMAATRRKNIFKFIIPTNPETCLMSMIPNLPWVAHMHPAMIASVEGTQVADSRCKCFEGQQSKPSPQPEQLIL